MPLILRKDTGLIPQVLTTILNHCVNGVTLSDPDQEDSPIIYANEAFERLTGYSQEEIIGRNCRFLQGSDKVQPQLDVLRQALAKHEGCSVTLRNYRKDGSLFHNRLEITPLYDNKGALLYYLGVQYDITYKVDAEEEIRKLNEMIKA
ncbi:MAG: PAS domain-containing protein [Methylococcaceae bacterium]|jgi:PAS domain S-box-containing protein|nr:PAS domain-containing protein [Methylococcaceae bacterium]